MTLAFYLYFLWNCVRGQTISNPLFYYRRMQKILKLLPISLYVTSTLANHHHDSSGMIVYAFSYYVMLYALCCEFELIQ